MVKFSKELEAHLIPEWKDAFVNYWLLKKHIKKIKLSRVPKESHDINRNFGWSMIDPVRSIFRTLTFLEPHNSDENTDVIKVRSRVDGVYELELVQLFSVEDEVKLFFEKLDEELDKVNQFYKSKEAEFVERGAALNKQLQILSDVKHVLAKRRFKNFQLDSKGGAFQRSWSFSTQQTDSSDDPSESNENTEEGSERDEIIAALERNGVNLVNSVTKPKTKNGKPNMAIRIDIPATNPARTIATLTTMLWEDLINNPKKDGPGYFFYKKKIQCAEKIIRRAYVELYKALDLLKNYSSLNIKAFTKILKKFDKVANQRASPTYLQIVKRSPFISSDKGVRLMDEVECVFTKHFAENDRKKAMKFLRPIPNKESHMVTFFVGLFTGCFVSLFSVYAILAHLGGVFSPSAEPAYMDTVHPVFSLFALLSLHLFMYGCNLFTWKTTRINYNLIFEFSPNTSLKYRDAFLICTTTMTAVVGAMVIHLLLRASGFSPSQVDAIPGVLLLISIVLLICPFDIFYRPTRFCFLRVIRNIALAPLYKILMADFFMADQLTSQILLLRHIESTACYLLAGSFKTHHYETCNSGRLYRELSYIISFLPYYWRAMQCARRWFDECNSEQLANMGKYVSAMVAAGARLTYARQQDHLWFYIVLVTSVGATVYQLYWDFVKDWGLIQPKSKNPWLRDELILRNKSIYYLSIGLNVVLRIVWVETVLPFRMTSFESRWLDFLMASLEVIRRGHWNFYRVEVEHLKNVAKYKAVKSVALPFH